MQLKSLLARARQELRRHVRRPLLAVIDPIRVRLARAHRSQLGQTTFIGVTGSCGKTTAKDLIAAICARNGSVVATRDTRSSRSELIHAILSARRSTRFCVMEFSGAPEKVMDEGLPLARLQIGVVTVIGGDHYSMFRTLEAAAAAKAKLIATLPPDGFAVLNADDPHVIGMAQISKAPILTFGLAPGADFRASNVSADWPERLSFTVQYRDQVHKVVTRLCGEHSLTSVLAALAAGVAAGVPLDEAIAAVAEIEPRIARMQPLEAAGVTFIRDEFKAPYWSIPASLEYMARARAPRKVIVLGTISDMPGNSGRKYRRIARQALEAADHVVFVTPNAVASLGRRSEESGGRLRVFRSARTAHAHLQALLRPGDLVFLKASYGADHLERIPLSWLREVACWRERCGRKFYCDHCALLDVRAGPKPASPLD